MQAAIDLLRRELLELKRLHQANKGEFFEAKDGSQHQADVLQDSDRIHRECDEIEKALNLLLLARDQAAARRRLMEEMRRDEPH